MPSTYIQDMTRRMVRASTEHTGAMIALVPSPESHAMLAQSGGEPPSDLHVTMMYLGEAEAWTADMRDEIRAIGRTLAARQTAPTGTVWAVGHFNPGSEWECSTFLVSGTELENLTRLVRSLLRNRFDSDGNIPTQHAPWIPHITLGYGMTPDQVDLTAIGEQIEFTAVRIAFGGQVEDLQFAVDT